MKMSINVSFDVTEENQEFIRDNIVKLVKERLNRWPEDISNLNIDVEQF